MEFITIILVVSVMGAVSSLLGELIRRRRRAAEQETLDTRVERLGKSLTNAVDLIGEIEREIQDRHSLVEKLRADIELNKKLAELEQPQVEAIVQTLRGQLEAHGRSAFWRGVAVNFVFFLMGAGLSLAITFLA